MKGNEVRSSFLEPFNQLPIATAEQAIARGDRFLSTYYFIKRPFSARLEEKQWKVSFDTTIIGPAQTVLLTIASDSGAITEFSREDST